MSNYNNIKGYSRLCEIAAENGGPVGYYKTVTEKGYQNGFQDGVIAAKEQITETASKVVKGVAAIIIAIAAGTKIYIERKKRQKKEEH